MEIKKDNEDMVKKHIESIARPIFEKVAQEMPKNQMLVGINPSKTEISYYQPHNFRRYYDFSRQGFSPKPLTNPLVQATNPLVQCSYKVINKNEYFFDDFYGCSIRVKKHTIQINNKKEHKRKYPIYLTSNQERERQIREITEKKEKECLEVVKFFIRVFGGQSSFKVMNRKSEDKVEQERMIDKLPLKQQWHSPIVKKVYNEKNIEFSDPVYAANYFVNRGIEDISPEIANELAIVREITKDTLALNADTSKLLNESIRHDMRYQADLLEFKADVRVHNKVLKGIDSSFKKFNNLLSQKKLTEF